MATNVRDSTVYPKENYQFKGESFDITSGDATLYPYYFLSYFCIGNRTPVFNVTDHNSQFIINLNKKKYGHFYFIKKLFHLTFYIFQYHLVFSNNLLTIYCRFNKT